jgi:hypothetical protein
MVDTTSSTTTGTVDRPGPRVFDDVELLRLAERPAEPLMPVLDRASAMWPLIVVFALFPITYAAYYRAFDDDAANWGLRAVDVIAADEGAEFLAPGPADAPARRFAAPLGSWAQAAVLSWTSPGWTMAIIAVSVVAIVLTGFAVHVALRRLAGARFALWTTLLVCCHPIVLAAGTTPAPRALGGWLQVAALGCLLRHRISLGRVVGAWNIAAGALLGLTLLASGPAYVVGMGTATLYVVLRSVFGRNNEEEDEGATAVRGTWRSVGALAVIVGTSLAVGGWWPVWLVAAHGWGALGGWLAVLPVDGRAPVSTFLVFERIVENSGFLLGFTAYGGWRCLKYVRGERTESRRVAAMLVAWFSAALLGWLWAVSRVPTMGLESFREWEYAAVVPLLALAVVGIEASRERSLGLLGTTIVGLLSLLVWIGLHTGLFDVATIGESSEPWWTATKRVLSALAVVGGTLGIVLAAWRATRAEDDWQRAFATMTIVALLVLQIAYGFILARRSDKDDRALRQFQTQLAEYRDVRYLVLVGRETTSPRVAYVVHRLWPRTPIDRRENRDEAVAAILKEVGVGERAVLLDVDAAGSRPFDPTGERFKVVVVSPRRLFRERRLRAHVLVRREEVRAATGTVEGDPLATAAP